MGFFARFFQRKREQPRQTPRGFLPDADGQDGLILFKTCSRLRLTYEIRIATFMARQAQKKLNLIIPPSTTISADLRAFADTWGICIEEQK
jgi:hypothetical protein